MVSARVPGISRGPTAQFADRLAACWPPGCQVAGKLVCLRWVLAASFAVAFVRLAIRDPTPGQPMLLAAGCAAVPGLKCDV